VVANEILLEVVFSNLLWNALKFVQPGSSPSIHISFETREYAGSSELQQTVQSARIIVADNGIGIAPEYLDRVFKIFERLNTRDSYPGTGMGLAIAEKAVELMDGKIGVASVPDHGSHFWFELPLAPKVEDCRPQPSEAPRRHRRPAVLAP
jgi:signal transduction histidine kinase